MGKYINFNNLRKKKGFVGGDGVWTMWWLGGVHLCENTKNN